MASKELKESIDSGVHHEFGKMVGQWSGETKTWFEPGDPVDFSPMTGTIKPLFDGRFVMHEYQGIFQGEPFEGITIYGHHLQTGKLESAWLDTFHTGTGIMFSRSEVGASFFNAKGSYQASAENPEQWGWRTEIKVPGADQLVFTAYNISPDGEESKATETIYHRK